MLLEPGNKLMVAHRRLFEKDAPRFFVGEVLAYQDGIVKLRGYSFVRDISSGRLLRKDDPRTKLVALASGSCIVYQLPDPVDVASVEIEWSHRDLLLKADGGVIMDLAELPHDGRI